MRNTIFLYIRQQSRIYRALFWLALFLFIGFAVVNEGGQPDRERIIKGLLFGVSIGASVVTIDTVLIPGFYQPRRKLLFAVIILTLLVFACLAEYALELVLAGRHPFGFRFKMAENLWLITPWFGLSLIIFLTEAFYRDRLERTQAELTYLKQQINPHFLLNTHNNIFFLINQDPDKASQMLMKLSGIMKYALYESSDDLVPLQREIQNLRDYIDLERIRKNENLALEVDFSLVPEKEYRIAPLILLTFVENAFKHVSDFRDRPNRISIHVEVKDDWLMLRVENTFNPGRESGKKGIGLQNAQKRLNLLYRKRHVLEINRKDTLYSSKLRIKLNHD